MEPPFDRSVRHYATRSGALKYPVPVQAIVYDRYGPPDVLELRDLEEPEVGDTDVLVRVRAAAANPLDWFAFTGTPYIARPGFGLTKPTGKRLGADFAGVVEKIGNSVNRFQPGDEVYGTTTGSFAELVSVGEDVRCLTSPPGSHSSRRRRCRWRRSPPFRLYGTKARSTRANMSW